jgi:hypothetical protein
LLPNSGVPSGHLDENTVSVVTPPAARSTSRFSQVLCPIDCETFSQFSGRYLGCLSTHGCCTRRVLWSIACSTTRLLSPPHWAGRHHWHINTANTFFPPVAKQGYLSIGSAFPRTRIWPRTQVDYPPCLWSLTPLQGYLIRRSFGTSWMRYSLALINPDGVCCDFISSIP